MAVPGRFSRLVGAVTVGIGLMLTSAAVPAWADEPLAPVPPLLQGACLATAHVEGEWGSGPTGGQVLSVMVRNTATTISKRWTVSWELTADQRLDSGWNAATSASGRAVTAVNLDYNGELRPGASTGFGFKLSGTGPAPRMYCSTDVPMDRSTVVTEADNGRSVYLMEGESLIVSLGSDYRPLTQTGTLLTQVSTSGGYPTGLPLVATYRPGAPAGPVELATMTDYDCLHISSPTPCALPQKQWKITVSLVVPLED